MSLINRHPVCTTLSNQESLVNLSAVSEGRAVGGCGLSTVLIHLAGTKLIWEIRSAIKENVHIFAKFIYHGPAARRWVRGSDII